MSAFGARDARRADALAARPTEAAARAAELAERDAAGWWRQEDRTVGAAKSRITRALTAREACAVAAAIVAARGRDGAVAGGAGESLVTDAVAGTDGVQLAASVTRAVRAAESLPKKCACEWEKWLPGGERKRAQGFIQRTHHWPQFARVAVEGRTADAFACW